MAPTASRTSSLVVRRVRIDRSSSGAFVARYEPTGCSRSQSGHERRLNAARAVRAHHDALDVVAGSVAADERPGEFDGFAVLIESDAFDDERGGSRGLVEQLRLARSQQHGFEQFAGARDVRAVLLGQDVI